MNKDGQVESCTVDWSQGYNNPEYDLMLNCPITQEEIHESIQYLKAGKSAGPDVSVVEFYKCSSLEIEPVLIHAVLLNEILDTGYFPKSWQHS